ncbi:hypothetical protein HDU67_000210 [Dinochytrium kinnereticum]|nr:hypothetical protein HDU67_000210 [Dinochytrium kinnereticum]
MAASFIAVLLATITIVVDAAPAPLPLPAPSPNRANGFTGHASSGMRLQRRYGYIPIEPPASCPKTYFVLEGQTCYSISQSLGMTLPTLQSFNPDIDCNLIYPTQRLCIEAPCYSNCKTPERAASGCLKVYEIQPGDSCWAIAKSGNVTVSYLQALNPSLACYSIPIYPQDMLCVLGPAYPFNNPLETFKR